MVKVYNEVVNVMKCKTQFFCKNVKVSNKLFIYWVTLLVISQVKALEELASLVSLFFVSVSLNILFLSALAIKFPKDLHEKSGVLMQCLEIDRYIMGWLLTWWYQEILTQFSSREN